MLSNERTFKAGDKVICFEYKSQGSFKPTLMETTEGEVVFVKDGWVYVDTMFGPLPFAVENIEWADAPF